MQIAHIQQAKPDVLLVALGQPKGEYWIENNLQRLNVPLSIQVGASFDFVAGNAQRAPKLWQKFGCEWLYRMLKDPKRLAPRYFRNAIYLLRFIHRDCIDWIDSPPAPSQSANPTSR
jgi:N-acetylglucosaminyldiphosphoundecaprenol N-acetyl-beta-D-mannosaminyltransferase